MNGYLKGLISRQRMIKATLSPGGLLESDPCVYILTLTAQGLQKMIWGVLELQTIRGPARLYKRLASHLAKRGKTMSCIHQDNKFSGRLSRESVDQICRGPSSSKYSKKTLKDGSDGNSVHKNSSTKTRAPIHEPELPNEIK